MLLWESLSFFSGIAYSSGYRKQYTSSLTSGLRFVIILHPAALVKGDCNSCAIYGASRLNSNSAASSTLTHSSEMAREGGYKIHSARSLPGGFPTQAPYTRWTLFSYCFFLLSFHFLRFPFCLRLLLMCSLCMPLYMVWKLFLFSCSVSISCLTFSSLASMLLICSTLKSCANSSLNLVDFKKKRAKESLKAKEKIMRIMLRMICAKIRQN